MTTTANLYSRAMPKPPGPRTAGTSSSNPATTPAPANTCGTSTPAKTSPAKTKRPFLHQVDLIRSTTFALVIFVHVLTQTTDELNSIGVNGTSLFFHATRYTFFALTGFVLMYQYQDREDFRAVSFWRRRMKLVIIPYILWSAIYWMVIGMWSYGRASEIPTALGEFWHQLIWGMAAFHLYFLLVMLQVYLLFPALRWLIAATRGHHGLLLGGSLALQAATYLVITYWTPPQAWSNVWWHHYATIFPYQFFVIAGALAAVHRAEFDQWITGKGRWLAAATAGTGAFALGVYLYGAFVDGAIHSNDSAFAVTLLPFLICAVASIYAMGRHWAANVRPHAPRFGKAVAYASNRSFPVFLVHVMVLFFLLLPKTDGVPTLISALGQPWATITVYFLTVAGSLAVVEVLRRLPGSVYLTGRPRLPFRWQI